MGQSALTEEEAEAAQAKRVRRAREQTSASQIEEYERCPRRWFNNRILGLRPLPTAAQKRGTTVDNDYVQPYLLGHTPKVGEHSKLLEVLKPFLPVPGEAAVQQELRLPTYPGGPVCLGYADFLDEPEPGWIRVGDLKTTSDFKYCKSADELRTGVQMITYGRFAWEEPALGAERVSLYHTYGRVAEGRPPRAHRSARPHARPCECKLCKSWVNDANSGRPLEAPPIFVTREHIAQEWGRRVETVQQMVIDAGAPDAESLTPNTDACDDFGGCPHRERCGIGPLVLGGRKKPKGETTMAEMSIKERLAKAKADRAGGEAPEAKKEEPKAEAKTEKASPWKRCPECACAFMQASDECPNCGGPLVPMVGAPKKAENQGARGVVPGDAPANSKEPAKAEEAPAEEPKAEEKPAEEPKKKPGRPKKMTVTIPCEDCKEKVAAEDFEAHRAEHRKAKEDETADVKTIPAPPKVPSGGFDGPPQAIDPEKMQAAREMVKAASEPSPEEKLKEKLATGAAERKAARPAPKIRPQLYIDCLPVKGHSVGIMPLEEWLGPIAELAAVAGEVEDWRLVDYKAKGYLATAIRDSLDTCPPALVIDSRMSGADVVLEILIPHAALVVRGIRS